MLNSKLLLFLMIFVLGGCNASNAVKSEVSDLDVQEGMETIYDTTSIYYGEMISEGYASGQFFYPIIESVRFTQAGGSLIDTYVMLGQEVNEGDVLAEISFDTKYVESELEKLRLSIEHDILVNQSERVKREKAINEINTTLSELMRTNVNNKNNTAIKIQNIKIRRSKAELEYYLYDSGEAINEKKKSMEELSLKLDTEKIVAPFDGTVVYLNSTMVKGKQVSPNDNPVMVASNSRFCFRAEESTNLKYGTPVSYIIGGVSFENVLSGTVINDVTVPGATDIHPICEVKGSIPSVFGNVTAKYHKYYFSELPIVDSSVLNHSDAGTFVHVVEDNNIKKRFIKAGISNTDSIHILYGVEDDAQLVIK